MCTSAYVCVRERGRGERDGGRGGERESWPVVEPCEKKNGEFLHIGIPPSLWGPDTAPATGGGAKKHAEARKG